MSFTLAEKMRFTKITGKICTKADPYCQHQNAGQ